MWRWKQTTVPSKADIASEWPLLSCARFTCDIYPKIFLLLLLLAISKNFYSCNDKRTAIERSVEGDAYPYCTGNKALGRFGIDCGQTLLICLQILLQNFNAKCCEAAYVNVNFFCATLSDIMYLFRLRKG